MKILILGAAGMVGRKLTAQLVALNALRGQQIEKLTLVDIVKPSDPAGFSGKIKCKSIDITSRKAIEKLIDKRPDVIFHLAAIVSGEAEANFDKGYAINLLGTQHLIESIRAQKDYMPRLVFTSSIAVFGAPFPDKIGDEFFTTPLTSYGTQKAIGELLINDYSRKGILDGISIRLPTICIRPGLPNAAASGFFSNILREPLVGKEAILPVSQDVMHWHASPRSAVHFLLHAAELDTEVLGARRALTMPGLAATVGEQIEALRAVAGESAVKLIKHEPNETIAKIVSGWPRQFNAKRALSLGFKADKSFKDIIQVHLEDELKA